MRGSDKMVPVSNFAGRLCFQTMRKHPIDEGVLIMKGVLRKLNCTDTALKRTVAVMMAALFVLSLNSIILWPAYAAEGTGEAEGVSPIANVQQNASDSATNEQGAASSHPNEGRTDVAMDARSGSANSERCEGEDLSGSQSATEECIDDEENPLALVQSPGYWSLVNVMSTALVSVVAAVLVIVILIRRGEDEDDFDDIDDLERRQSNFFVVTSLTLMASSLLGVLITQDFTQRAELFDVWSPLFLFAAATSIVLCYRYWKACSDQGDSGGTAPIIVML